MVLRSRFVIGYNMSPTSSETKVLGFSQYRFDNTSGAPMTSVTLPVLFQPGALLIVERQTCFPDLHYTEDLVNHKLEIVSRTVLKYDVIPKGAKCLVLYIPA